MQRISGVSLVILILLSACSTDPVRTKQQKSESAEAYTNLGLGYLRQGNRPLAMDNLIKAVETAPHSATAQHSIALAYQQYGRPELADKHYKLALKIEGENGLINNNYGAFLCQQEKFKEAVKFFDIAIDDIRYETPERALENAGLCALSIPDNKIAEVYFRRALKIEPRLSASLLELAKLKLQEKKYLSVRAFIQRYNLVATHTSESLWISIQAERELQDENAVKELSLSLENGFPDSKETKLLKDFKIGS